MTNYIFIVLAIVAEIIAGVFLKLHLDANDEANLQGWILTAVEAAEQIFKGSGRGVDKKNWVLAKVHEKYPEANMDDVDISIESAVLEIKQ